jgi:CMP-N,N'-diacetyllegionaminic acid synthase
MINGKSILAVITARAGSKGLPGKNYLNLNGKPLIQYSIEAGLNSKYIDSVILSSDCKDCINIANKMNLQTPFIRPSYLAGDKVASFDVIEHTLNFLSKKNESYDLLVLLEPTSPLRTSSDVDSALEKMMKENAYSLVSVAQSEDQHPDFTFKIDKDSVLSPWDNKIFSPKRRQDIEPAYYLDGSIYISHIDKYLENKTFCYEGTSAFIMPKHKSFEVDDIVDLLCVEAILKNVDRIN